MPQKKLRNRIWIVTTGKLEARVKSRQGEVDKKKTKREALKRIS